MSHERPTTKVCNICKSEKCLTEFHKYKQQLDGHDRRCKECIKIKTAKYAERNRTAIVKLAVAKVCSSCGVLKQPEYFSKDRTRVDGIDTRCRECSLLKAEKYRAENKGLITERRARDSIKNNAKAKVRYYANHEKSKDKAIKHAAMYRSLYPEKARASMLKYRTESRERYLHVSLVSENKRRAIRLNSKNIYANVSEWYDFAIDEIYSYSRLISKVTGIIHEVDHFIPLKGKKCTGLHVPENLQVIPKTINRRKSNIYVG